MIKKEKFEKLLENLSEQEEFRKHRIKAFENMQNSAPLNFRYGLNIEIKPDF